MPSDTNSFENGNRPEVTLYGYTLRLVKRVGSKVLQIDGRLDGVRVRTPSGFTDADLDTHNGREQARNLLESVIREHVKRREGGAIKVAERQLVTRSGLTLGGTFDLCRERILPKKNLPYRRNLDKVMRMFEGAWGRDLPLKSIEQDHVDRYGIRRMSEDFSFRAADPGSAYLQPHKTKMASPTRRHPTVSVVRQDLLHLVTIFAHVGTIKDSEGNWMLVGSPLAGIEFPKAPRPRQAMSSEDRFQAMLAVADEAEKETRMRRTFTNTAHWVDGSFRMQLLLYRMTSRRQNPVRMLQRRNIVLDPVEAMEIARKCEMQRADEVAMAWPFGGIWYEGAKDKGDDVKKSRDQIVPISKRLHDELTKYMNRMPHDPDAWLFPSPTAPEDGVPPAPVLAKTQRKWFLKMEERAGIPHQPNAVFHSFRRLFRTERENVHPKIINILCGWASAGQRAAMESHYMIVDPWKLYVAAELDPTKRTLEDDYTIGGVRVDLPAEAREKREQFRREQARHAA